MDLGLKGKVVFVAGASRGIGRAIAEGFLAEGAKVMLTGRGEASLKEAHDALAGRFGAGRIAARAGDLTRTDDIEACLDEAARRLGPVDIVIANVGLDPTPPGFDLADDVWAAGLAQNLDSAFRLGRAALKRLEGETGGNLVFISSIAGLGALGTPLTYGTAKAAINHLAKELARLVGQSGVRVNVVCPGNILFPGGDWEKRVQEREEAWTRWVRREVPLKRFGRPEEIADAVLFVASARASFMTGAVVPVDGGQTR